MNYNKLQKLREDSNKWLKLHISNGNIVYDLDDLFCSIEMNIDLKEVLCIGVFGSCVERPRYVAKSQRVFFGLINLAKNAHVNYPNDIDIFIIGKSLPKLSSYRRCGVDELIEKHDGYGECWTEFSYRKEALQLFYTTTDKLTNHVYNGDSVAINMVSNSEIIFGEMPDELSGRGYDVARWSGRHCYI